MIHSDPIDSSPTRAEPAAAEPNHAVVPGGDALHQLLASAGNLSQRGVQHWRGQAEAWRDGASAHIRAHPMRSVAIAASTGMLIALLLVGSPVGHHDTLHHLPVVRGAVVASAFGVRFQGQGCFVIDAPMQSGSSGAPVLRHDPRWRHQPALAAAGRARNTHRNGIARHAARRLAEPEPGLVLRRAADADAVGRAL